MAGATEVGETVCDIVIFLLGLLDDVKLGVFIGIALGPSDGTELEGCEVNEVVGFFEGAFDFRAEEGLDVGFVVGGIKGSTVALAVGLKVGS